MAQYNSFPFQQKAIEQLVDTFKRLWQTGNSRLEITFKSPTGSGKTFMTTHFIDALNRQPDWDEDVAFVWITFSDDLAMQSKEKYEEYFYPNQGRQLLTIQDFKNGLLKKNDILFLNWQKLVSKKASDRVLRRPNDENLNKEQGFYFEDVVEKTHAEDRQIVMVIDESHKNVTEAAIRDVINPLNPRIILKVSATPETEPLHSDVIHGKVGFVEVELKDVIAEGLIKEEIVSQTEEDLSLYENKDHDKLLLDLAIERRNALVTEWKSIGEKVNPLVLIQLPNDDKKTKDTEVKTKEEIVTEYLINEKNIGRDKIAYWFDGRRENMEGIANNDNKVQFMLFKYAAGTGWDCPRAHILVMYREIKSNTFHTQTLGRIRRMAVFGKDLSCHSMLRTGYLYTNYQRNEVQNPDEATNPNKPKTLVSGVNKVQKKKMLLKATTQTVTEIVAKKLTGDPKTKEKVEKIVSSIIPHLAETTQKASEISETEKDILVKENKINEQKIETSNKVKKAVKEILGEKADDKLNEDINGLISNLVDSMVDNRRDAEIVLDPCLLITPYSRTDYGDIGKASLFQNHFCISMNKYIGIDANMVYEKEEQLQIFEEKGVRTSTVLERDVMVNAHFRSDVAKENDFGKNVKYEVSDNDVEKEFSWRCYEILGDQADDETRIGNVARSWGTLKEALRIWFGRAISYYNNMEYYKVFLNDVNKGDNSVFRKAIRRALIDYRPILDKYLEDKQKAEEKKKSVPFVLKTQYAFPDDYKVYEPSALSYVQPFRLPEEYAGRKNETDFINYLEQQPDKIEWWFKNGTGKDALSFKYIDKQTKKDRFFYPDWIIKFKDNRVGIYDTKGGITAKSQETKDKAECLAKHITELNQTSEKYKYVGGIIEMRSGIWYLNSSTEYIYEKGADWHPFLV